MTYLIFLGIFIGWLVGTNLFMYSQVSDAFDVQFQFQALEEEDVDPPSKMEKWKTSLVYTVMANEGVIGFFLVCSVVWAILSAVL